MSKRYDTPLPGLGAPVVTRSRTFVSDVMNWKPDRVRDLPGGHPETLCDCGRCYLGDGGFPTTPDEFLSYLYAYDIPLFPTRVLPAGREAVYLLLDPRSKVAQIRYVGKAKDLRKRYYSHLAQLDERGHKTHWIRSVLADGYLPIMMQIDECDTADIFERERVWISRLRAEGARLTNVTDGGESGFDGPHNIESKRKLSASVRKPVPPVVAEVKVYRQHTPESAGKIIAANRGEANHQAKLTWEKVRQMRALMSAGFMNVEVAEMFGVSITQVCRIRLNKSWREVT